MIRVLIADDHAMVREGLASVLSADGDIDVIAAAANGREAVDLATALRPDVVVMDLSMPVLDGIAATRGIRSIDRDIRILVLTSFTDRDRVRRAIDAGAIGYQLKDAEPSDLRAAVRAAHAGHAPLDPRVAGVLLSAQPAPTLLSAREREVLALVARGLANKQ
ncbi:MAG TPA: response regulator transcription factor, partial [Microbacterium sp.]|nr:response regulator transcription factor [Microbacterium sp.]